MCASTSGFQLMTISRFFLLQTLLTFIFMVISTGVGAMQIIHCFYCKISKWSHFSQMLDRNTQILSINQIEKDNGCQTYKYNLRNKDNVNRELIIKRKLHWHFQLQSAIYSYILSRYYKYINKYLELILFLGRGPVKMKIRRRVKQTFCMEL